MLIRVLAMITVSLFVILTIVSGVFIFIKNIIFAKLLFASCVATVLLHLGAYFFTKPQNRPEIVMWAIISFPLLFLLSLVVIIVLYFIGKVVINRDASH